MLSEINPNTNIRNILKKLNAEVTDMLMKNFDFYDIYAVLIQFRFAPSYKHNRIIAVKIKELFDATQKDNTIEANIIRSSLASIQDIDRERYGWAFTNNVYTYGHKTIKEEMPYKLLSAGFSELIRCLDEHNEEKFRDLADALHNIPIILTEEKKNFKKTLKTEISFYRQKWHKNFLKDVIG